jgi:hypothetical protein
LFQRVIPGEGHTFPVFPKMSHKKVPARLLIGLQWRVFLSMVSVMRKN